jgi:hypothetical protein
MASVNYTNRQLDQTVRIFDEFYSFSLAVDAAEWDIVNSYFTSIYTTREAAGNFSVSLFRIAAQSNIPVLDLLSQLQTVNGAELNITLTYYANSIRSASTLLGVSSPTQPNFYVARNVRS